MKTRRTVLLFSSVAGLCSLAAPIYSALADSEDAPADRQKIAEWMDGWIAAQYAKPDKPAYGTLGITRFADPFWYLTRSISWVPLAGVNLPSVTVPVGFVTDLASIPPLLWSALPRDGDYAWAAVIHDYLYWKHETTFEQANDIFNAAMTDFKIPLVQRLPIYQAVKAFGRASWEKNARLIQAGEKRVLKLFPSDPTISWEEWKKRPDVF